MLSFVRLAQNKPNFPPATLGPAGPIARNKANCPPGRCRARTPNPRRAQGLSCETKPIAAQRNSRQVLCEKRVMVNCSTEGLAKTKPIPGDAAWGKVRGMGTAGSIVRNKANFARMSGNGRALVGSGLAGWDRSSKAKPISRLRIGDNPAAGRPGWGMWVKAVIGCGATSPERGTCKTKPI
jgi:hypothetical protein